MIASAQSLESHPNPRTCYNFFFWGVLLVLFRFNVVGFDLFPYWLGYGLIWRGAHGLAPFTAEFRRVQSLALWLLVAAITHIVVASQMSGLAVEILAIAIQVARCSLIWLLLDGVACECFHHQHYDLVYRARVRRNLSFWCLLSIFVAGIAVTMNKGFGALGLIVFFAYVISVILICSVIRNARIRLFGS